MPHQANSYDILVVGGGVFGLTVAIELARRKHRVGLINPDSIPHHLAASTDISKAVRMEYGSDKLYFRMAEICIKRWNEWNQLFEQTLYHQTGFLMLCQGSMGDERQAYERNSYESLRAAGYQAEILNAGEIKRRFPSVNTDFFPEACFNPVAGFVESGLVISKLKSYATSTGVEIMEGQTADELIIENHGVAAVRTKKGSVYHCGHAHIAAGAHTPLLVPELKPYIKATGHPVFWLKPENPTMFQYPRLSFFTADISNTGWYGFPYLESQGVVKVARHSSGLELDPEKDDRRVTDDEVEQLRAFLKDAFPSLQQSPIVFTRRCLYTDTLDGHYWIDIHPSIQGLSVGTGGSGHGLKMAPLLGEMQADIIEGGSHPFSERFRWRDLNIGSEVKEEARFME